MQNREQILTEFYTNMCDEDVRMNKKHRRIEFITTTKYIDEYIDKGYKILEVGAGTGAYSLHYAKKGYGVTAVEYVKHNLDILKSKITDDMKIEAYEGDAIDLSRFATDTFDMVLVLGPLYHLYTEEEVNKCIEEAKRVCKKDGILMFAYLPNDSIMVSWALLKGNLKSGYENGQFDENFKMISEPNEIMRAFDINEVTTIMNNHGIKYLKSVATAGIAPHFREIIDNLSDEEYDLWVKYHLSSCERREIQGYSTHMLYIGKK
ncbi:MAG: class I SAM-dependent methyltransferase [Bacilli bacterium]|nr:class I SAM-dependent methyltransferase [Bacilli bacterium]MDE6142106.1 class I SAM-dependent methyltransferase [Bacilli bacterium]